MARRADGSSRGCVCRRCQRFGKITVRDDQIIPKVDRARDLLDHKRNCPAREAEGCVDPTWKSSCRGFNLNVLGFLPPFEDSKAFKALQNAEKFIDELSVLIETCDLIYNAAQNLDPETWLRVVYSDSDGLEIVALGPDFELDPDVEHVASGLCAALFD